MNYICKSKITSCLLYFIDDVSTKRHILAFFKYLHLRGYLVSMYCALSITIVICAVPKTLDDVVEIIVANQICEK